MDVIDYVERYSARGWPVFRIRPNSKIPFDKWVNGRHGEKATCDANLAVPRWCNDVDFNVGIATGHALPEGGYLTVLDLDTHADGYRGSPDWADSSTYAVSTPSGGLHLYYVTDEPVPNSVGQLGPGIDVRGVGGMVVAPPSRIGERGYALLADVPLIQVSAERFRPSSVYMFSEEGQSSVPYDRVLSQSQPRTALKRPENIMPGERNAQLMANAAVLYAKWPPDVARELTEAFNRMMPEPLTAREVGNITTWLEAREHDGAVADEIVAELYG